MAPNDTIESETKQNLVKCLELFVQKLKISDTKYTFNNGSKKGDNYLGQLYRIEIEGERNKKNFAMSVYVKCLPSPEVIGIFPTILKFFDNEIKFYDTIVPLFQNSFPAKLDFVPSYYTSYRTPNETMIVLEDLRSRGFVMNDKFFLDYNHARLMLQLLGKFHAFSFALRDRKPEAIEELRSFKEEIYFSPESSDYDAKFTDRLNLQLEIAKKVLANEDEHYRSRYDKLSKDFIKIVNNLCNGNLVEPYAVLIHGDFSSNNTLFRYNEETMEPEEIFALDFQLARYASPVLDVLYLLYICTTPEFRKQYYDEMLDIYYDSLSNNIRKLGSDPDRLYPHEIFQDHMQRLGKFGAAMAILLIHIFSRSKDSALDIDNDLNDINERVENDQFFISLLKGALKDCVDRNYLQLNENQEFLFNF